MHMLSGLSDGGEGDTFATEIRVANEPAEQPFRLPKPSPNPLTWVGGAWNAATALTSAAALAVEGAAEIVDGLLRPAAPSSLTGPVTTMRRYSAAQVSLKEVATVCHAFDVTLNDVALAAITDSYRAALIRRGEQPRRDSLCTLVPVSVRSNDATNKTDNRVSAMLPFLLVDKADRAEQLRAAHRRLIRVKSSGQRQAGMRVYVRGQCGSVRPYRLDRSGADPHPAPQLGVLQWPRTRPAPATRCG